MEYMNNHNQPANPPRPVSTYHELMHAKTLYRVTSVFLGKVDLKSALEDLTVRRVARESFPEPGHGAAHP